MTISTAFIVVIFLLVVCLGISCSALGLAVTNKSTTNKKSAANKPNFVVERDSHGNFSTGMITLEGILTNPTDVATKAYVDVQNDPHQVINESTSTNNHLAAFHGTTGTVIENANANVLDVVTNTGTSTANSIVTFANTSGKVIQSGSTTLDQLVPYVGATRNIDLGPLTMKCKTQQVPTLGKMTMTNASSPISPSEIWSSMLEYVDGNLSFAENSVTNSTSLRVSFGYSSRVIQRTGPALTAAFRLVDISHAVQLTYIEVPVPDIDTIQYGSVTITLAWREVNGTQATSVANVTNSTVVNTNTATWDKTVANNLDLQCLTFGSNVIEIQPLRATFETIFNV